MWGGGILLLVSFVMLFLKIRIPYIVEAKEILASSLMVFGFVYKKTLWHLEDKPIFIIPICGLIVALGTELWPCDMLSLSWQKVIPYFFSGLSGTLMIFSLCKLLCKFSSVMKALVYIGDRTIDVLTWHLLSFKIVSIVIIVIYKLPIARLAEFPVIREYNYQGWWLLYTIIGVMVSLLLGKLFARVSVLCSRSGRISSANH